MRPTRVTGPALAAALVLLVGACGDDTTVEDPGESASESSAAETPTPTPTPEAVEPVDALDFGAEPSVRPAYKKAALRAVDDDLITMVPTVLPDGWTTGGGGYQPDPQWWRMAFTAPTGDVVLDQLPGTAEEVLADQQGLTVQDDVDLSDWGTGTWSAWDHDGAAVLAYDLKGSTVILQGADLDTVQALAQSLLPAEDSVS
ncbi:MAG: hypothetical protein LH477_05075, partial [Nocardioides sp.]|nr:hypothetical protein [Nocardioides sp.]